MDEVDNLNNSAWAESLSDRMQEFYETFYRQLENSERNVLSEAIGVLRDFAEDAAEGSR